MNPAVTYMHGIFFLTTGQATDAGRARESFQRVVGMAGANPVVNDDLALARRVAGAQRAGNYVWVIFENGQTPLFEQMNMTVPMPVLARGGSGMAVTPVTVSMLRMVPQSVAVPSIGISAGSARATTRQIANIEAVVASEFRQRYPGLLAATVFEAVAKAAMVSGASAMAGRKNGTAGALLNVVATTAANVTSSDTRSWYALPREFQAVRVATPVDGKVMVEANGMRETLSVEPGQSSIIYVKQQHRGSPMHAQVFRL